MTDPTDNCWFDTIDSGIKPVEGRDVKNKESIVGEIAGISENTSDGLIESENPVESENLESENLESENLESENSIERINVERRWLDAIVSGDKKVEGKCIKNRESTISRIVRLWENKKEGQRVYVIFYCGSDTVQKEVKNLTYFFSFRSMLDFHGLDNVLPGVESPEAGIAVYRKYYSEEQEQTGIIALELI